MVVTNTDLFKFKRTSEESSLQICVLKVSGKISTPSYHLYSPYLENVPEATRFNLGKSFGL